MTIDLNYWAVIAAAITPMIIGTIWYSEAVLGKPWMKIAGLKEMKPSISVMIFGFMVSLLMAYVLAYVVKYMGATDWIGGAKAGALMWIGFVATVFINQIIWEKKPVQWLYVGAGAPLINLIIMGIILAVWQ